MNKGYPLGIVIGTLVIGSFVSCNGSHPVSCHRTYTVYFKNFDTTEYTVVLKSKIPTTSHWKVNIMLNTVVVSPENIGFSMVEYIGSQDRKCSYYSTQPYYSDIWVEASVYRDDSVLLSTINLYPWDTTQSDHAWTTEGDDNSQYSDTIFLSGLDSIQASKRL